MKKSVKKSAREKAMDHLALRDHSRTELVEKLSRQDYSPEEISKAIDDVDVAGWLMSSDKLAEKVSDSLHRKKKGHMYIAQYLEAKGLPPVPRDSERELEKAKILLKSYFSKLSKSQEPDKKKFAQFLKNRGFDDQTITKICRSR